MAQTSTAVDPAAPLQLLVLGELARGGMARVDLARVLPDGEVVALKRLHRHLALDPRFVEMFTDEVWMTAALQHDNVVKLVAYGHDAEGMYLAMELVRGAPLSLIASEGRGHGQVMPPELLTYVALQIARGLGAAHGLCDAQGQPLGLVHRDVTPSNVLVAFDGAVKLTDFGVARAAGRTSHTATGVLKGKVAFMSPEYARHRHVDARSDLYSLGVTMFAVACGRLPFDAEHDLELLRRVAEEEAPSLRELVAGFDAELAELVARLLSKRPEERPASAVDLAAELEAWLAVRGYQHSELRQRLASYASRHAGTRERHLQGLMARGDGARRSSGVDGPDTLTLTVRLDVARADVARVAAPAPRRREERRATRVVGAAAASPGADALVAAAALVAAPAAAAAGPPSSRLADAAAPQTTETATPAPRLPWSFALTLGAMVLLVGVAALWLQLREPPRPPRLAPGLSPGDDATPPSRWQRRTEVATDPRSSAEPASVSPMPPSSTPPSASAAVSVSPSSAPPSPRPPPRPRSCTPADFDYPSCLSH